MRDTRRTHVPRASRVPHVIFAPIFPLFADAKHRAPDRDDHSAVEYDRRVDRLAVHQRTVHAMEVLEDRFAVPDRENRMTLAYLGGIEADAAGLRPSDHVGSGREFARLPRAAEECRQDHISG